MTLLDTDYLFVSVGGLRTITSISENVNVPIISYVLDIKKQLVLAKLLK